MCVCVCASSYKFNFTYYIFIIYYLVIKIRPVLKKEREKEKNVSGTFFILMENVSGTLPELDCIEVYNYIAKELGLFFHVSDKTLKIFFF